MKFEGGSDEAVGEHVLFWMTAGLDVKGLALQKKLERIEVGVSAMKEALERAGGGRWLLIPHEPRRNLVRIQANSLLEWVLIRGIDMDMH